jgi:hypothetical protein
MKRKSVANELLRQVGKKEKQVLLRVGWAGVVSGILLGHTPSAD